jgi:hypothetical protein
MRTRSSSLTPAVALSSIWGLLLLAFVVAALYLPLFTAARRTTVASKSSRLEATAISEIHSLLVESWKNIGL